MRRALAPGAAPGECDHRNSHLAGVAVPDKSDLLKRKHPASKRTATPKLADLKRENASLRRALAKLEVFRNLAYRDPLTGLWNRRYFEERLAEEVSRASRAPGRAFTVVMIDVNDLKALNDVHGHAGGDQALRWVGEFLRTALRSHDVCCRTGGDEFTLLVPDVDSDSSSALLGRLRRALDAANDTRSVAVGLSLGAASYPQDASTPDKLVELADREMYRDKRRQKGPERSTRAIGIVAAPTADS